MPIKKLKPITSGTRHMSILVNNELDKVRPEKSLVEQVEIDIKVIKDYIELLIGKEIN